MGPGDEEVRLMPNRLNPINVTIKFDKAEMLHTPSLVNAVERDTDELVYSWLLIVETVA